MSTPQPPSRRSTLILGLAVGFGFSLFLVFLIWGSCIYLSRRKKRILLRKAEREATGIVEEREKRRSNESQRVKIPNVHA